MSESKIQKKILDYLKLRGAYTVKIISANKKGVPDVIFCYQKSFIALEIKTPKTKNNTTKLQDYNILKIREAGGTAEVVWSVEQVSKLLDNL